MDLHGGTQKGLAKALGVEQGTVSSFLAGKRGVGIDLLRALERLASSTTMSTAVRRGLKDPYPTRAVAIELGRGAGVHEQTLLAVMSVIPPTMDDPGEDFWREKILDLERRRQEMEREVKAMGAAKTSAGPATSRKT